MLQQAGANRGVKPASREERQGAHSGKGGKSAKGSVETKEVAKKKCF